MFDFSFQRTDPSVMSCARQEANQRRSKPSTSMVRRYHNREAGTARVVCSTLAPRRTHDPGRCAYGGSNECDLPVRLGGRRRVAECGRKPLGLDVVQELIECFSVDFAERTHQNGCAVSKHRVGGDDLRHFGLLELQQRASPH